MSRLHLTFACGGATLAGTLDTAPGTSGLLIVSGGNEVRSGAFSGQARLAAAIAAAGFPVFRFDRRGIGDSEGENRGFRKSGNDIRAAIEAFRAMVPAMNRVVAFGNCDAASALMLMQGDMCDGLVLSNPWTIEQDDGAMPAEAIRSRYLEKLRNPRELVRLVTGEVNLRKLARGLVKAAGPKAQATSLAQDMARGLDASTKPYRFLLAEADRTAQAFRASYPIEPDADVRICEGASHAYAEPHAREWLRKELLAALRGA
ncbi:Alpha/beta hydrolase family protein [Tsuneonella dongtanensis]|uniref:Alpha/beta hydrolase family protein n=1 Tax=Tsuneonella dongtanensis TaxID=692370 RepID=A0A1B2AFB3_9SPHN|nr:hydrolase 1, exosortase A system-associated [Tsuneonella dongtanensis]ANY20788.1 Alpha/beta hydrolase family protein [Tsuneonella dongtanensis]